MSSILSPLQWGQGIISQATESFLLNFFFASTLEGLILMHNKGLPSR